MLRNIIGPVFWLIKMCVFLGCFFACFSRILFCLQGEWDFLKIKNQKNKNNLDQFLTYKKANLGPVFNSTAHIYIYITFLTMWNHVEPCGTPMRRARVFSINPAPLTQAALPALACGPTGWAWEPHGVTVQHASIYMRSLGQDALAPLLLKM